MPSLQRAASCALPIIFTCVDHPQYPGMHGTCTALRFSNETVFVTAAHVIGRDTERTSVDVALGFQGEPVRCRIGKILKPRPAEERFEAASDFAVMIPLEAPAFVAGASAPLDLNGIANLAAAPRGSVFCVCGYPKASEGNVIDYGARTVTVAPHVAFCTYDGPAESAFDGQHMLDISTADFGGPNGLSGGPVFRLRRNEESETWAPSFAGIVTNGGPRRIRFIDVALLSGFLLKEIFRSEPASRANATHTPARTETDANK